MAYLKSEIPLKQISSNVFCDDFLFECHIENRLLPNPYYDNPFLLIPDFLSSVLCKHIVDAVRESSEAEQAMVKKTILQSVVDPDIDESIRKTAIYKLPAHLETLYHEQFIARQKEIERYFNVPLTTSTTLQVLEYTRGAFYQKHADDSSELVDGEGNTVGFVSVAPQRKLTTVLFASSWSPSADEAYSFSGGELVFNYLYDAQGNNIRLYPKAGEMVVFPSNPIFSHEVKPVTKGYRLTLVQWHNAIAV